MNRLSGDLNGNIWVPAGPGWVLAGPGWALAGLAGLGWPRLAGWLAEEAARAARTAQEAARSAEAEAEEAEKQWRQRLRSLQETRALPERQRLRRQGTDRRMPGIRYRNQISDIGYRISDF